MFPSYVRVWLNDWASWNNADIIDSSRGYVSYEYMYCRQWNFRIDLVFIEWRAKTTLDSIFVWYKRPHGKRDAYPHYDFVSAHFFFFVCLSNVLGFCSLYHYHFLAVAVALALATASFTHKTCIVCNECDAKKCAAASIYFITSLN